MAKRITEKQKNQIIEYFINNKTLDEISEEFNFTKSTISRNLKKNLGEKKYYEIKKTSKSKREIPDTQKVHNQDFTISNDSDEIIQQEEYSTESFLEIAPLEYDIEGEPQKDLSSIPVESAELPKLVYMIVDKKIELEPKLLKDYVEWNFLSNEELQRKTIEVFFDLKNAKRACSKEQKVIKVPNSNVFKIAAPFLLSQGISRIVSSKLLISL